MPNAVILLVRYRMPFILIRNTFPGKKQLIRYTAFQAEGINVLFFSVILFIYISSVALLPGLPSANLPFHSPLLFASKRVLPTHPLEPHPSSIPLCWGIKPPQNQGPSLPLKPDKAILCYIFSWSHGSLHVYSLVSDLVPGSCVCMCGGGSC